MSSIYALVDDSGDIRYIGKANCPVARLKSHMREMRRRMTPLYDWLRKHGAPTLIVVEDDCADWEESERQWIAEARCAGANLLNVAAGGAQPHNTKEQRKAHGHRLAAYQLTPEQRSERGHALMRRMRADPKAMKLRGWKLQTTLRVRRWGATPERWGDLFYLSRMLPDDYLDWFERLADKHLPRWTEAEWDEFEAAVEARCAT